MNTGMNNSFIRLLFALAGGVPVLAIAGVLVVIWVEPGRIAQGQWLKLGAMMVMIEFLLLHSGAFMAVGPAVCSKRWQQVAWFIAFTLVYGIFFTGMAYWIGQAYVAWLLAGVLVSRLLTLVVLHDIRGTILMLQRSAVGMMVLVLTMFLVLIPFPELGITEAIRYDAFGRADDILTEHPQRFLVWGASYYLVMGLMELYVGWRLPDWSEEEAQKAWDKFSKS